MWVNMCQMTKCCFESECKNFYHSTQLSKHRKQGKTLWQTQKNTNKISTEQQELPVHNLPDTSLTQNFYHLNSIKIAFLTSFFFQQDKRWKNLAKRTVWSSESHRNMTKNRIFIPAFVGHHSAVSHTNTTPPSTLRKTNMCRLTNLVLLASQSFGLCSWLAEFALQVILNLFWQERFGLLVGKSFGLRSW